MEGIRGIQHPLETPIILEEIFKNLDIRDLQRCREVCRTWRQESGKSMRALAKVEIYCNGFLDKEPFEFLELVKSDQSTFFQAPFADTFTVMSGVADCPEFWETCGIHIKHLELYNATFSSAGSFRHAIFQCCPNLQRLDINNVQVLGKPTSEPKEWIAPQFTQNRNLKTLSLSNFKFQKKFSVGPLEILSQFPCVEKISTMEIGNQFENFFRTLEIARQHDASGWKLNEVTFKGGAPSIPVPPSFARVFRKGDLTLTSLSIQQIASDTENVTTLQKILVAHAHSLKKLEIHQNFHDIPQKDIFPLPGNPVLEKVQALKLICVEIRSTRFLQAFPNINKLMIEVEKIPEDTLTPPVTLNDCTQLIISVPIDETEDFKRLFGLLPNLKKLKLSCLDNERFSLICENWPDLTHLELNDFFGWMVDDASISGYDEEDVTKINKRGGRRPWRPITVRRANLSSLKNLRSFVWWPNPEAYSKLGYCSVACGILELSNLKYLRQPRVERIKGSNDGFHKLFNPLHRQFLWDESQKITFD